MSLNSRQSISIIATLWRIVRNRLRDIFWKFLSIKPIRKPYHSVNKSDTNRIFSQDLFPIFLFPSHDPFVFNYYKYFNHNSLFQTMREIQACVYIYTYITKS